MPYDDWGAWYDYDEYLEDDDDYERCCDICGTTDDNDHEWEMHLKFDARQATLEYFARDKRCPICGGLFGYDGWFAPDQSCMNEHGSLSCEQCCNRNLVLLNDDCEPIALYFGLSWMARGSYSDGLWPTEEIPF